MSKQIELILLKANAERRKGHVAEARRLYQSILERFPGNVRARKALAELPPSESAPADFDSLLPLFQAGRFQEIIDRAGLPTTGDADQLPLFNLLAAAHARLNQLDEAVDIYSRAIAAHPGFVEGYGNLGILLLQQGRAGEAAASLQRAIELNPASAETHSALASACLAQGKTDAALVSLRRALERNPRLVEAHNNMGNILAAQGRIAEAADCYRHALAIRPAYPLGRNNLGNMLRKMGRLDEAVAELGRAIALNPAYAEAHNGLGSALADSGRLDEAIDCYRRAIALNPDYAAARANLGNILVAQDRLDEAVTTFAGAVALNRDDGHSIAQKLAAQAGMGDWTAHAEYEDIRDRLATAIPAPSPFSLLVFEDDPARSKLYSERHAHERFGQMEQRVFIPPPARPAKLKVGYFSADFRDHATMHLMAGLFRAHDRDRFEIHAFSYGRDSGGEQRDQLAGDVHAFHDIASLTNEGAVARAGQVGLDIAVDLKGHTRDSRTELFAGRLAPVQINYLGYPGTIGASFIDYIIADETVIPLDDRQYYSEQVIHLPGSYQVNDDRRVISSRKPSRSALGLPERGFVFCCFNNSYKIGPAEFDIWMRLLDRIDGSVLWLLKPNPWVEIHFKEQAQARGIDPIRLVFAEPVAPAEHLARHGSADLFLDTFKVNAHTTASDALWAGLPVVTRIGRGFAGRVAASLLKATGLSELIAGDIEAYERLALALATDGARLTAIREKLAENRSTAPLFDTALTTRLIEAAYDQAFSRFLKGLAPAPLTVSC